MIPKRLALVLAIAASTAVAAFVTAPNAQAIERNFAGSAQFDASLVPTDRDAIARDGTFDGITTEVALKLAVDVTDKLSANVKVCYGCHGFEVGLAHLDYRIADELNFRIGRFSPSLGAFNLRHDPANHKLSDKPLIYDMGRMLRRTAWNLGVVPSPFPDNGLEVNGTHWFGEKTQLDYAVYAVSGFKGDPQTDDLDWVQSRSLYYVDNNARPTLGGRVSLTTKLGSASDLTVGASGQEGYYDPSAKYAYAIFGADASLRIKRTSLRFEYLGRRQEIDTSDPTKWRFDIDPQRGNFFLKHGGYAELETPIAPNVDLMLRYDILLRSGNIGVNSLLETGGDDHASVQRGTLGFTYALDRALRIKTSVEYWRFSDPIDPPGTPNPQTYQRDAVSIHLGVVGTY